MKKDMTVGSPLKQILLFALPLFASNLFQQFYNLADTAIVGHMLGDDALSAVGAVSCVYGLIVSVCFGMTNGFSILISRYFGAKDERQMKKSIAGTVMLSFLIAIIMTIISCLGIRYFLQLLNTPADIFESAYEYIIVILAGCIVTVFYNMEASILRALGNSMIPLVFLIISSILNIGFDFWFIGGFDMGIKGAAYATLLSQLIAGLLCLLYIIRYCPQLHLSKDDFKVSRKMLGELMGSGTAMCLMYAVVNVGTVILQAGINGLGSDIIAAHVSARKISEINMMPIGTLSGTMATYASQNYGAGKMDRIREGMKKSRLLGFCWCALVLLVCSLFAEHLLKALTGSKNPVIIETGVRYLKWNVPFYAVLVVLGTTRSALQGIGSKVVPVISSSLEMIGKILVTCVFIDMFDYLAVCLSEPVVWIVCAIPVVIAFRARMREDCVR